MKGLSYKALRRKAASLLNGTIMPRFGVKLVRSWPKTFTYRREAGSAGVTTVAISGGAGSPARVRLRDGTSDWMTFDQIFIDEDYDLRPLPRYPDIVQTYRDICARGTPLIVDLGANIGLSPLYFSMVWPKAKVVGLEPDAGNFALFRENVAGRPTIDALNAGAASQETTLHIVDPSAGKNAFRTLPGDGAVAVPGMTIGALVARYRDEGCIPFAIKIDIEGAEADLFSNDVRWIDEFPLMMVELHDWLYPGERTSRNFLRAVAELDRDFVYLDENIFSIRNDRKAA